MTSERFMARSSAAATSGRGRRSEAPAQGRRPCGVDNHMGFLCRSGGEAGPESAEPVPMSAAEIEAPQALPAHKEPFWVLTMGSIGVVFGDIGTSPLYAMREALAHVRGGASEMAVLGVVSLVFWALI